MFFKNPKITTVSNRPFNLEINGEKVECVSEFNFLGVMLDDFLSWKPHIKMVTSKISRTLGVIKRVRKILPFSALKTLYNSLIVPHINYGLKLWGPYSKPVELIQKRAIRVITTSKFFAHTSPLFKKHSILKIDDMYKVQCLKLHYKIENNLVPEFFKTFTIHNRDIHDHFTRGRNELRPTKIKSSWLRHYLPTLVLETPDSILSHVMSSSIQTFSYHLIKHLISKYETECRYDTCLPCGKLPRD